MKELQKRIFAMLILILMIAIPASVSLTRTISDTSDDVTTFIRCSNGNYYSNTEANLQTAINSIGNASGWVKLGSDLTITDSINLWRYMTLDLDNHNVTISGNNNGFEIAPGCTLKNGIIKTTSYTGHMINIDGSQDFSLASTNKVHTTIEDLTLSQDDAVSFTGTGIHFDSSADGDKIINVVVDNVRTFRFNYGINMSCYYQTGFTHWCNANQIDKYTDTQSIHQIYLYRNESATHTQGGINGNFFTHLNLYRIDDSGWYTNRSIYETGAGNYYQGEIWDTAGTNVAIEIKSCSSYAQFIFPDLNTSSIYNNGTDTRVISFDTPNSYGSYPEDTMIHNSNGLYYPATEANLKILIEDLGNASGWVDGGWNNVSLSDEIYVGDNLELRNFHFWQTASTNGSMIASYSGGAENCYLHDLELNGNSVNQDAWRTPWALVRAGVYLQDSDYAIVERVNVTNFHGTGILVRDSNNVVVDKCRATDIGMQLALGKNMYWAKGIMLWYCNYSIINSCFTNNTYSSGIVYEEDTESTHCHDGLISNCIASNTSIGFYTEGADKVKISNCIAYNCSYASVPDYGNGAGFRAHNENDVSIISSTSKFNSAGVTISSSGVRTSVIDCFIEETTTNVGAITNAGDFTKISSCDFNENYKHIVASSGGDDLTINDCTFYGADTYALDITAKDFIINGNTFYDCGDNCLVINAGGDGYVIDGNNFIDLANWGITTVGDNGVISNNLIQLENGYDRAIRLTCENVTVNCNFIYGASADIFGIEEADSGADYNSIIFNHFVGVTTPIEIHGANTRINCTGYDDWNFYDGVS